MAAQPPSDTLQRMCLAGHRGGLGTAPRAKGWPGHAKEQSHTGALLRVAFSNSYYWGRQRSGNLYLHFQLCLVAAHVCKNEDKEGGGDHLHLSGVPTTRDVSTWELQGVTKPLCVLGGVAGGTACPGL